MKIVIVIPTYNEAENITRLIPELSSEFGRFSHHEFHILVVDGNSPDGTGERVEELASRFPFVHLLKEKEKKGLGAAYLYGFTHAMQDYQADAIVEMDADFQHDPKDFPKMISAFDEGYDYVIGSRYVRGGSIPKEWAMYRKFLSIGGNIFSKVVLGIFSVNDFTTGFKLSRVSGFLDRIDFSQVNSSGFAYKIDLLYKMHKLGARIKEVPISFGLRDRGNSKMEKDNMFDSMRVEILLRYEENKSFFRFLIVGFAGLFVDSGLFGILRATILSPSWASVVSGFLGMATTFTLNNLWSFGDRKLDSSNSEAMGFVLYFVSSYIPIIFRSWLVKEAVASFGDSVAVAYGSFFVGIFIGLIWNYLVYSRIIWKKK